MHENHRFRSRPVSLLLAAGLMSLLTACQTPSAPPPSATPASLAFASEDSRNPMQSPSAAPTYLALASEDGQNPMQSPSAPAAPRAFASEDSQMLMQSAAAGSECGRCTAGGKQVSCYKTTSAKYPNKYPCPGVGTTNCPSSGGYCQ